MHTNVPTQTSRHTDLQAYTHTYTYTCVSKYLHNVCPYIEAKCIHVLSVKLLSTLVCIFQYNMHSNKPTGIHTSKCSDLCSYKYTSLHAYIQAYIHACAGTHASLHAYMLASIHTCMHAHTHMKARFPPVDLHGCTHTCMYTYTNTCGILGDGSGTPASYF